MKIKSMSVQGVRSFCGRCDFDDFQSLNLFIGPNGVGKSNALFLISGLLNSSSEEDEDLSNRETYNLVEHETLLEIKVQGHTPQPMTFTCTSIDDLAKPHETYPTSIHLANRENDQWQSQLKALPSEKRKLVEFIVNYALGDHYELEAETFSRTRDLIAYLTNKQIEYQHAIENNLLPSSAVSLISTFVDLFSHPEPRIACFDEPETNLEARSIRRLFEVFCWMVFKAGNTDGRVAALSAKVEQEFAQQMSWLEYPSEIQISQIFLASHSNVFLNCLLSLGDSSAIYEFDTGVMHCKEYDEENNFDLEKVHETKRNTTIIRRIDDSAHSILDGLGCAGADLLQCNGVVWVEGPSDAIYISKWLEMYSAENKDCPPVLPHVHFEFQPTGGAILRYHFFSDDHDPRDSVEKLFKMLSISRNAFIVIDGDAAYDKKGELGDQSNFEKAKNHIEREQKAYAAKGFKFDIWYPKGNKDVRTLESYVTSKPPKTRKIQFAKKQVESWTSKKLSDFEHKLEAEIKKLYNCIVSWQEAPVLPKSTSKAKSTKMSKYSKPKKKK